VTFAALKRNVFILEALNGFAASIYFNYLFFFLKDHFGFGNKGNLFFGAINGFLYVFGSLYAGRFAQKKGYFTALKIGFTGLIISLLVALFSTTVPMQLLAMCIWTIAICFTWPVLEALSCEGESAQTLPKKVGLYNLVWSFAFAFGYFVGGGIIESFGWKTIFILPAVIHAIQLMIVTNVGRKVNSQWAELPGAPPPAPAQHEVSSDISKRFLRMAWLANPFAYIAMNSVIPLIPSVAAHFHFTPTTAGFICSIWMFARLASFVLLWKWTAWHYRFGWLVSAYILLILSFTTLLLSTELWLLIVIQIVFGWSVGLIYYSSLFYSMDASDTKGEHGGIHEAAIGAGIFGGPAIGLAAMHLSPAANASVWAVSAVLGCGLLGLFALGRGSFGR
jgi:MFS family permease